MKFLSYFTPDQKINFKCFLKRQSQNRTIINEGGYRVWRANDGKIYFQNSTMYRCMCLDELSEDLTDNSLPKYKVL